MHIISVPKTMHLIISPRGKLEEAYYGSQDIVKLAVKHVTRYLQELNKEVPTETK